MIFKTLYWITELYSERENILWVEPMVRGSFQVFAFFPVGKSKLTRPMSSLYAHNIAFSPEMKSEMAKDSMKVCATLLTVLNLTLKIQIIAPFPHIWSTKRSANIARVAQTNPGEKWNAFQHGSEIKLVLLLKITGFFMLLGWIVK